MHRKVPVSNDAIGKALLALYNVVKCRIAIVFKKTVFSIVESMTVSIASRQFNSYLEHIE